MLKSAGVHIFSGGFGQGAYYRRRILKHCSTYGIGYPKLATYSAMHSVINSDFL